MFNNGIILFTFCFKFIKTVIEIVTHHLYLKALYKKKWLIAVFKSKQGKKWSEILRGESTTVLVLNNGEEFVPNFKAPFVTVSVIFSLSHSSLFFLFSNTKD